MRFAYLTFIFVAAIVAGLYAEPDAAEAHTAPSGTFLTKGRLWVAVPLILLSALAIIAARRRLAASSRTGEGVGVQN